MAAKQLSPREEEIVELCVEGLTNEQIAYRLGLSIGTVNTYRLRIKFKVGGLGKTDTVVKVLQERAERARQDGAIDNISLPEIVAERAEHLVQYRVALSLLQLALDELRSAVWATDTDLTIQMIANGEYPSRHLSVQWEPGKTVYDLFHTNDDAHPAIAVHREAINGRESEVRLPEYFSDMRLRVLPLYDDGDNEVLGCISILNTISK